MILAIVVPKVGRSMRAAQIHRLIAQPGAALRPGSPLLELRVDLEETSARDCPAVIYFRLIAAERAYLRTLHVAPGDLIEIVAPLGVATSTLEEDAAGPATRVLRCSSVAIPVDPFSA